MQSPNFDAAIALSREITPDALPKLTALLEDLELDFVEAELRYRVPPTDAEGMPPVAPAARQAHQTIGSQLAWIYSALLVCYLAAGDLDNARFVSKRVPAAFKESPDIGGAIRLLVLLWNREDEQFYAFAAQTPWSEHLAQLIALCTQLYRDRMLALLKKAYATVKPQYAAKLLGVADPLQLVTDLRAVGWEQDADGYLCPPAVAAPAATVSSPAILVDSDASWRRVQDLAKIVVNLELQG